MILEKAFFHYKNNIKASLAFALLLVFVPIFSFFESVFASSGSMFLDYNTIELSQALLFLPAFLLFLVFYAFFISIIVFSVRKDLSNVKLQLYLQEMIQKFSLKLFVFFALFSLLLYAVVLLGLFLGASILALSLVLLVVSLLLLFVPQSIVVDEEDVLHAILNGMEFISKNPKAFLQVVVVGTVLLAVVALVGEAFDAFSVFGAHVSLLLTLVFVLPFLESMKTYLYMMKFELIKSPQLVGEPKEKKKPVVMQGVKRPLQ